LITRRWSGFGRFGGDFGVYRSWLDLADRNQRRVAAVDVHGLRRRGPYKIGLTAVTFGHSRHSHLSWKTQERGRVPRSEWRSRQQLRIAAARSSCTDRPQHAGVLTRCQRRAIVTPPGVPGHACIGRPSNSGKAAL